MHVPKTAGTYINHYLTFSLSYPIKKNKSNIKIDLFGHMGWKPITENTYTISSFRDPVSRLVSYYCFMLNLYNINMEQFNLLRIHTVHPDNRVKDLSNPTLKEFMSWVEKHEDVLSNYQSKNFSYNEQDSYKPKFLESFTADLRLNNFSKEETLSNIKKINVMLKHTQANSETMKNVSEKILLDLGINETPYLVETKEKASKFVNDYSVSKRLFSELSKKDIEYLESINLLDMEIYNTDSLFWNNGK